MCGSRSTFSRTETKYFVGATEIPANQLREVSDVEFARLFPHVTEGYTTKSGAKKQALDDRALWSETKWREIYEEQAQRALDPNRKWGQTEAAEVKAMGIPEWVRRKMEELRVSGVTTAYGRYLVTRSSPPQAISRVIKWERKEKQTICGAKCRGARGPNCDCICEGKFHGAGLTASRARFAADIDLQPTQQMAENAARGLELRKKHGRGGTAVGVARARFALVSNLKIGKGRDEDSRVFTAIVNGQEIKGKLAKGWSRLGGWGWTASIDGVQATGGFQISTSMRTAVERAADWIKTASSRTRFSSADIDLKPTAGMAANAARGLELRAKHGRGGTAVGVARARDLKNRANLSPETVKRMHSFFSRHEGNQTGGEGDAGYISFLLWGGAAGREWAASKSRQLDKSESARRAERKSTMAKRYDAKTKFSVSSMLDMIESQSHDQRDLAKSNLRKLAEKIGDIDHTRQEWDRYVRVAKSLGYTESQIAGFSRAGAKAKMALNPVIAESLKFHTANMSNLLRQFVSEANRLHATYADVGMGKGFDSSWISEQRGIVDNAISALDRGNVVGASNIVRQWADEFFATYGHHEHSRNLAFLARAIAREPAHVVELAKAHRVTLSRPGAKAAFGSGAKARFDLRAKVQQMKATVSKLANTLGFKPDDVTGNDEMMHIMFENQPKQADRLASALRSNLARVGVPSSAITTHEHHYADDNTTYGGVWIDLKALATASDKMSRPGAKVKFGDADALLDLASGYIADGNDEAGLLLTDLVKMKNRGLLSSDQARYLAKLIQEGRAMGVFSRPGAKAKFAWRVDDVREAKQMTDYFVSRIAKMDPESGASVAQIHLNSLLSALDEAMSAGTITRVESQEMKKHALEAYRSKFSRPGAKAKFGPANTVIVKTVLSGTGGSGGIFKVIGYDKNGREHEYGMFAMRSMAEEKARWVADLMGYAYKASRPGAKAAFDKNTIVESWTSPKGTRYDAGLWQSYGGTYQPYVTATYSDGGEQLMTLNEKSYATESGARKRLAAVVSRMKSNYSRVGAKAAFGSSTAEVHRTAKSWLARVNRTQPPEGLEQFHARLKTRLAEIVRVTGEMIRNPQMIEDYGGWSDEDLMREVRKVGGGSDVANRWLAVNLGGSSLGGFSRANSGGKSAFAENVTYSVAVHIGHEPAGERSTKSLDEAKAYAKAMLQTAKANAKGKPVVVDVYPVVNYEPKDAVLTLRASRPGAKAAFADKIESEYLRDIAELKRYIEKAYDAGRGSHARQLEAQLADMENALKEYRGRMSRPGEADAFALGAASEATRPEQDESLTALAAKVGREHTVSLFKRWTEGKASMSRNA